MKHTITTPRTAGRKVKNLLLAALSIGGLYGAWLGISAVGDAIAEGRNAHQIRAVIKAKDYDKASELFGKYQANGGIDNEDVSALALELNTLKRDNKKGELERDLEKVLAAHDLPGARVELEKLRNDGFYTAGEIAALEERVADYGEDRIFNTLMLSPSAERSALIDRYLVLYPQGPHASDVARVALIDALETVEGAMRKGETLQRVKPLLDTLYSRATVSAAEGVVINPVLDFERLADDYANDAYIEVAKPSEEGNFVRTVAELKDEFSYAYFEDRSKNIPLGSVGKVVGVDGKERFVRFDGIRMEWKTEWSSLVGYWKDGPKNVGKFHQDELQTIQPLDHAQRHLLRLQLDTIVAAMRPHLSSAIFAAPTYPAPHGPLPTNPQPAPQASPGGYADDQK